MMTILERAFGGLEKKYLYRQYVVGMLIAAFYITVVMKYGQGLGVATSLSFLVNTALYPYSRFLFETAFRYVFRETKFDLNSALLLLAKVASMILCWTGAVFIAPIGLAYIYYYKSQEKN